jgi:NADH:quinone reductase (non-electrogenic)
VTRRPDIPGLAGHAFEIKSLTDAVALRDHTVRLLETADAEPDEARRRARLRCVVVGGSFTGVEVAGEFHVFMRHASRGYPRLRPVDCSMTLVEASDRILPALDDDLSRYALAAMRRRGIDVRLRATVRRVEADRVTLDSGEEIPTHTLIWCAGIQPPPLAAALPLPKDRAGWILCEPDLRVRGMQDVWAIGDCAVKPDADGRPYPATAQHAVREGTHLARNIGRVLRGETSLPFIYASPGTLAPLGCRTAVARMFGVKLSGFPAWFLWRSVYLMKMPGWSRKARIALDWTMDLIFRREFVQLGVHRAPPDGP